jgi:hypothetical protein
MLRRFGKHTENSTGLLHNFTAQETLAVVGNAARSAQLEPDDNSSLVPEVALIVVATREGIAKAGQQVVKLHWSDGDVFVDRYVDASTNDEIKGIVARGLAGDDTASRTAVLVKIPVEIAVSAAEQSLSKWLEMLHAELEDRTNVVGEQVALSGYYAICISLATIAIGARRRDVNRARIAAIALELAQDTDVLAEVVRDRSAAAVQIERAKIIVVLRIGVNERIIKRNFNLRCILREGSASEKQNERNKK